MWLKVNLNSFPIRLHIYLVLDSVPDDVLGTKLYLEVCWNYANIFMDNTEDLPTKTTRAPFVTNFLRIWHNYSTTTRKETQRCMLSREAVTDVILSCRAVVMYIIYIRDLCPGHPIELGLTGTDCCESYFSENGSSL